MNHPILIVFAAALKVYHGLPVDAHLIRNLEHE